MHATHGAYNTATRFTQRAGILPGYTFIPPATNSSAFIPVTANGSGNVSLTIDGACNPGFGQVQGNVNGLFVN